MKSLSSQRERDKEEMKMEKAVPYVGMVSVQVLMAGSLIASKKAILEGMTNYTYLFYSNAFASFFLLPVSFLIHRSRPPLSYSIVFQFFGLGFLGCLAQLIVYESLKYVPASFASAILNLIPGFTFILAIIFRMEKFECGSSSSLAKSIGTVVSIAGAVFATLYHGPQLSMNTSNLVEANLFLPGTNLALGGSLITLGCLVAAIFVLSKAVVVKKYPAELIILFFYCSSVAVISFVLALLMDGERVSWTVPISRFIIVLYSGLLGSPLQVGIALWCMKRKGPLFVAIFQPLGIFFAAVVGIILVGDPFYLGTLLGSIIIVTGLYAFLWGKAHEGVITDEVEARNPESASGKVHLLQNIA